MGQRGWAWLALLLDVVAVATFALAVYRIVNGPIRIRWERTLILSVGDQWRPWLLVVAALAARAWIHRHAAFDPLRWLRPAAAAIRRGVSQGGAARSAFLGWRERRRRSALGFYALLTLGSFLLAAPASLSIWPYVYWLPGLNFVRVPARFTILTALGVAVLAGFGLDRLAGSARTRRWLVTAAVLLGLAIEYSTVPMRPEPYSVDPPAIDRWLNTLPKPFAIAEVPLPPLRTNADIAPSEKRQAVYMLHSTAHWQKTVHAFSGFRTPLHEDLYAQLRAFPDYESLKALARLKVDYVVVHTDYYPRDAWARVEPRLAAFSDRLQLVHSEGAGRVYRIR